MFFPSSRTTLPWKTITKTTHQCLYSTTSASKNPDAATIASSFLSKFQSRGPQTRTQLLDANQLHLLTLTLNRPHLYPSATTPKDGTPLPPGYHLVYFTPLFLESELGADGTDTSYNPSAPFTRRMWAGGEVRWPRNEAGKPNLLRVGQTVTETTRVISAEPKVVRKTGEEMIVVGVEKRFENEDGVAVVDRRYALLPRAPLFITFFLIVDIDDG
jgi:hydroxyacyl-ACP dehydratase HTD2-like protein with hotdog domain